jgi:hypothetical protein
MQFTGDYAGNPPSMLKDMFKINLFKTMKKSLALSCGIPSPILRTICLLVRRRRTLP